MSNNIGDIMNQIGKFLKINSKNDIKSYLTAILIALLGGVVLAFAKRKDLGSFESGYLFSAVILIILVTAIFSFVSVLASLDKNYPLANKLGFTREEISYSLVTKDVIFLVVPSLIIYGLSHVFVGQADSMPNYGSHILDFFVNGRPSFTAIFTEVLMGINFAIIASTLSFIIGFPPGPAGIILYVIFSSLMRNHISSSNPIHLLIGFIVFILTIVFRHIVVVKFDPKK